MALTRRLFASSLALAVSNPLPIWADAKLEQPFSLGIASGEPAPDGAVLWTRLAPNDGIPAAMANRNIPVQFEISETESFTKLAKRGTSMATPALGHSVHAEIRGLKPNRWYWYRFLAAGERSAIGRFKTTPAANAPQDRLRFAVASCQQWTQGLWTAYQHMADEDLDAVLHLGDYIYEQGYRGQVRPEGQSETFTLEDYRARHALYKSDPFLQAAHARFPWIVTWDDHEVSNNYANDIQEKGQPREEFLRRRASAYQAFYEFMPLRRPSKPNGPNMTLHRRLNFGKLLRLHMLDTRQYRSDQVCGDGIKKACPELNNPAQTLLGAAQERWLTQGIAKSPAVWDAIGQQIFVTYQDFDSGPDEVLNLDSWSGYPLARQRLIDSLSARPGANPVILTGDVHSAWAAQLHRDAQNTNSPCVAAEFVATSISSGGDGADATPRSQASLDANPQIRYFNGKRGYLRCDVTPTSWRTDYRSVEFVSRPGAPANTKASFRIAPGQLKLDRA
jgi:alkaline phosphatase D